MGIHPDRITVPPWAILGYRADGRPIRPLAGGAEVDDGSDIDIEVDDEQDEASDEAELEEQPKPKAAEKPDREAVDDWTPPSREEWERVRRTLAKRKEEKLAVQRQLNELRDKSRERETEAEKAVREASEMAEARYKPIVVKKAARAALIQAGATVGVEGDKEKTEARLSRLLKLIDVSDVSIEDDGDVLGLDEQIEGLRADWPELFAAQDKARTRTRPTGAPRPPAPEKPKASWEQHAARALGKA